MPANNDFKKAPIEMKPYRLLIMQNNIDTYKVALGVAGLFLVWAQGCFTRFSGAVALADVEAGEGS